MALAAGRKDRDAALLQPDTGLRTANVMFHGIDVGTSSVKAVLIDGNDHVVAPPSALRQPVPKPQEIF